jgi:hypothetical protein
MAGDRGAAGEPVGIAVQRAGNRRAASVLLSPFLCRPSRRKAGSRLEHAAMPLNGIPSFDAMDQKNRRAEIWDGDGPRPPLSKRFVNDTPVKCAGYIPQECPMRIAMLFAAAACLGLAAGADGVSRKSVTSPELDRLTATDTSATGAPYVPGHEPTRSRLARRRSPAKRPAAATPSARPGPSSTHTAPATRAAN